MSETPITVVLTGATGFIGSAVLAELLQRGCRPVVVLRPASDASRIERLGGFECVTAERLDDLGLVEGLRAKHPEVFIHCAWRGVAGEERNSEYQITHNVPLAITAAKLAADCGCRHWIGLGSQAEYGNLNRVISETAPTVPTTLYGKAKLAAGIAALALCEARGLTAAWLRVFSTYGPGDAPHWMVPYVIREFAAGRAPELTLCEQSWDYLFVDDAARAVAEVAARRAAGVFNLGSGRATPLRHIVDVTRQIVGAQMEPKFGAVSYRPDQVMHLQADIAKLKQVTDWRPTVSLEEGLRRSVAHFRSHASAPTYA